MSDNNINYSNNNLAGGGFTEAAVNAGYIANTDGSHTPRTDTSYISAMDMFNESLPESQRIIGYDKPSIAIWEQLNDTGRIYVGYDGLYRVEFLPGHRKAALAWKSNYILTTKDSSFKEDETESGRITYILTRTKSEPFITELGLDVEALKTAYDASTELTPSFTNLNHVVPSDVSTYLLTESLDVLKREQQAKADYKLFSDDISNYVDKYFGGERTGTDIGFYIDKSGRIRATYDSFAVYRGKQLVDDLLEFSDDDDTQYAVGYLARTGSIQFVLSKELSAKFLDEFGSYDMLSRRWNNTELKPTNFNPGESVVFEAIVNIEDGTLLDANTIFGFDAVNPETKKTQADKSEANG